MDLFLQHGDEILRAAEASSRAGQPPSDLTILVGDRGQIHMVAGSDWPLESLQRDRGAAMAYRVSSGPGGVRVTGRSMSRTLQLQSEPPAAIARRLLLGR